MTEIFNITHDAGNLNEYTSVTDPGSDVSAEVAAALASTAYGLQIVISSTADRYGQKDITSPASNQARLRIYLDPNTLTMGDTERFVACSLCGPAQTFVAAIILRYTSAAGYQIDCIAIDDAGGWHSTAHYSITDAEHYVEMHLIGASGTGSLQLWIDGIDKQTVGSLDNDSQFDDISRARLGAVIGLDAGTSGTLYLDELKANDDGSEIGPVVPSLEGFASIF